MTPLLWRDDWTLGVAFMDDDHRALAELLNRVARDNAVPSAQGAEQGRERLMAALNELEAHTREHFHREEEAMRASDYPDLALHKSEHDQLLAELAMLLRDLRERSTAYLDPETFEVLKDWLMGHLLDLDRPLAAFLRQSRSPVAGD